MTQIPATNDYLKFNLLMFIQRFTKCLYEIERDFEHDDDSELRDFYKCVQLITHQHLEHDVLLEDIRLLKREIQGDVIDIAKLRELDELKKKLCALQDEFYMQLLMEVNRNDY